MRGQLSWVLLAACAFVDAAPGIRSTHKVKETINPPSKWTKGERAPSNAIIELRIALPQPNFSELERHLAEVSDPFHERYGQHLSKEEVDELITPHPHSVSLVDEWLELHGLRGSDVSRTASGDWVKVKVPISLAEEMLDTTYHVYTHKSGTTSLRTTSYSLPEHLHEHIEFVQPTTLFSNFHHEAATFHFDKEAQAVAAADAPPINVPTASGGKVDASCNTTITVSCLKQLYNAVGYVPSANNGNKVAVTGYLEQFANINDLQLFYADQVPDALNTNFTFVSINGGLNNQTVADAGAEANLDTQFAFGITHPIPPTFFSTAGRPPFIPEVPGQENTNEPYLDFLDFVLNHPNPPQTISTSYADDEQTVPKSFAQRVCNGFGALGARGVSLTFSSGDGGVGDGDPDPATQECFTNDGTNRTQFLAGFPPSCPFVTAVGGTIHIPETAVDFSGGGFSNLFSRPAYQNPAVPAFLSKLPKGTFAGLFNPNGRAFPDVSAQADNFKIFFQGRSGLIGGTSASAPTFAGFVALLNDARVKAGLPTLGFLNPLIYAIGATQPTAFNDITTGHNPGCGTEGFNATTGWDPVTGWGTPNFGRLKDVVTGKLR